MKTLIAIIALLVPVFLCQELYGQTDQDPPVSPVLSLVSVDPATGNVGISWLPSTSPDVEAYVVYLYKDDRGYELDTLYSPSANYYLRSGSGSGYYSESFVVAAMDTAGNISPLSNQLSTIYATSVIDTCRKTIEIRWNSYNSIPKTVNGYTLLCSVNGGSFSEIMQSAPDKTSLLYEDFNTNSQYCFTIRADLAGGYFSLSNRTCLSTKMQKPPEWINADYASALDNNRIEVGYTVDPSTDYRRFVIERKEGDAGDFENIGTFNALTNSVTDNEADFRKINYYRIYALNNCNTPFVYSNIASNIVLSLARKGDENNISLSWNKYREWLGSADRYSIYVNTGSGYRHIADASPGDTTYTVAYKDLMYDVTGKEICFRIRAFESMNPHGISGESTSGMICTNVSEMITIPNAFTPDNNGTNDLFIPVLSFRSTNYHLIITTLKRKTVFESSDQDDSWDGTFNGTPLPEGVYLWHLEVRTPSGNDVKRNGTVTIIHNSR